MTSAAFTWIVQDATGVETLQTAPCSTAEVKTLASQIDWSKFQLVTLQQDEEHWINVSGNTEPDGLACLVAHGDSELFLEPPPFDSKEISEVFCRYFDDPDSFQQQLQTDHALRLEKAEKEASNYNSWKEEYHRELPTLKRKRLLNIAIGIASVLAFAAIVWLWHEDELRFIGRDTQNTTAYIDSVTYTYHADGTSSQLAYYRFYHAEVLHFGTMEVIWIFNKQAAGDSVLVKYVKAQPEVNKVLKKFKSPPTQNNRVHTLNGK